MKITPRLAVTLTFIAFGVMAGAQVGAIPVLKNQAGVDAFTFGILASIATLANIIGLSLAGFVNRRFDHRTVLLFILPLVFTSLVYSLGVHSILSFGLSFMIFNFGLGTLDVFMNAEASVVEHRAGKPIFSSFHAAVLYAIGLSGLAGGYIAVNEGPLWAATLAVPFVIAAIFAVHVAIPQNVVEKTENVKRPSILPYKILILIGAVLGLDVAAELSCVQWAGQLLSEKQPALAEYSGLGVGFYGLCNGTVRLFGDRLRSRFADMPLVAVSFATAALGFGILATNPGFAVSVLAFALAGCGLALIFPCLFSVAASLAPQQRAAALGFVSGVSGPPRILLPVLLGLLASTRGLSTIYLAVAVSSILAIGFTFWTAREIRQTKGAQVALRPNATN